MPAGRTGRQRAVTNENDENAGSTRLTRAKAAALTSTGDAVKHEIKKPSQVKRTTSTTSATAVHGRRRAALGDVSNVVSKNDAGADTKDAKKGLGGKPSTKLVSKAAMPTKVEKPSRTKSTRAILGTKDKNVQVSDLKRPASGSGVHGSAVKKRQTSGTSGTSGTSTVAEEDVENRRSLEKKSKQPDPALSAAVGVKEALLEAKYRREESEQLTSVDEDYEIPGGVRDLDAEDIEDPLMVAEYVHEIFHYLRQLEGTTMANPDYMKEQTELEWRMRGILIDWLLEVHMRFRLLPETLFLAVNVIDRFLSIRVVQLDRLQLVGVTAMFIASKYEEVLSPHVQNFRHVADDGFTEEEILHAERYMLSALNYDLSYPNPMNFLRRISKADNYDIESRTMGKYLLEISCVDYHLIKFPPSQVAAAAMYLARLVLNRGEWDDTLEYYAGYSERAIQPVFDLMISYLTGPVEHEAFYRKYATKKFMRASIIVRHWAKQYKNSLLSDDSQ